MTVARPSRPSRKCCGGDLDFARSLCRCRKWKSSGGKSNVFFAKTLDDRFVIKQVTPTELNSFLGFGPQYFHYLSDALSTGAPTCLAKTLGIYQVSRRAHHRSEARRTRVA
jgi:1-phosphatidylinositol-3-phosphate 5-kinase